MRFIRLIASSSTVLDLEWGITSCKQYKKLEKYAISY